jgi:hypothetical protein
MESTTEAIERLACFRRDSARARAKWEDLSLAEEDTVLKRIIADEAGTEEQDGVNRSRCARVHCQETLEQKFLTARFRRTILMKRIALNSLQSILW